MTEEIIVEKKKKMSLPTILTAAEKEKLLSQFNKRYYSSHRNMLMIKLSLVTGMRISEVINLQMEDITPVSGTFKIHLKNGKGGKDRMLFITPEMYFSLVELHESHDLPLEGLVFPARTGHSLDDSYVRRTMKKKGEAAGISNLHFHLLRHTYLSELFSKTKDIRLVQEVAGHASIKTTMIYVHISGENIRMAMTA